MSQIAVMNVLLDQPKGTSKNEITSVNTKDNGQKNSDFSKTINDMQETSTPKKEETKPIKEKTPTVFVKSYSNKVEKVETLEETPTQTEEKMQALMALLMSHLGMTLEEVEVSLNQLNIKLEDLAGVEQFSEWVSMVLGESKEALLLNKEATQLISNLWQEIEKLNIDIESAIDEGGAIQDYIVDSEILKQDQANRLQSTPIITQEEKSITNQYIEEIESLTKTDESLDGLPLRNLKGAKEELLSQNQSQDQNQNMMAFNAFKMPLESFVQVKDFGFGKEVLNHQMSYRLASPEMVTGQMIDKLDVGKLLEGHTLEMELSPKELGKVNLKLTEQNGAITAQIQVENERTKNLVLQNIEMLRQNLEKQGMTVTQLEVDIKDNSSKFQMEKQKQKASKRIEELIAKEFNEIEDTAEDVKDQLQETQVDYTV